MEEIMPYESLQSPIGIFPQEVNTTNKKEIGSANILLGQLPALLGVQQLSTAYKVVIPPGTIGKLMELSDGCYTSAIVGNSGKIVGQARMTHISLSALPLAAFSVMSIITGQYFMAQINKSIKTLSEKVDKIQKQIDIKEESIVFSNSIFLQEIQNDWTLIIGSENFKNCIVTNILKSINDLTSSCYYFENVLNDRLSDLGKTLEKNRLAEEKLIGEISRNLDFLKYAFELRSFLKTIFLFLISCITKNNADEIKETIKCDEDLLFSSTINQLESKINGIVSLLINAPNVKLQEQALSIRPIVVGVRNITTERYNDSVKINIETTIDKIKEIDEKGQVFYIAKNRLYIDS